MKFIWEPNDVFAGRRVGKVGRTEQWMIGYDPTVVSTSHFALISLEDGMICKCNLSRLGITDHLNKTGDYPIECFPAMKHAVGCDESDSSTTAIPQFARILRNPSAYVSSVRKKYPRAYEPWSKREDEAVRVSKLPSNEIARMLGRSVSAIDARIEKLKLSTN